MIAIIPACNVTNRWKLEMSELFKIKKRVNRIKSIQVNSKNSQINFNRFE